MIHGGNISSNNMDRVRSLFVADALKGAQLASSILFSSAKSHAGFDSMDTEALLQAIGDHPRLRKVTTDEVIGIPITRVVANLGLVSSHGDVYNQWQSAGH